MNIRDHINLLEQVGSIEKIKIAPLPYKLDALAPCMSKQNVDTHYNILTKNYFKKYSETGDLFQKAGAILHNDYFWPLLKPYSKSNKVPDNMLKKIKNTYRSDGLKAFKKKVLETALSIQGNGWVLILKDLQVIGIQNHVLRSDILLAIDLWEHSTRDFEFNREKFLEDFWNIVDWEKIEQSVE